MKKPKGRNGNAGLWTQYGEGEGGSNRESNINIYTLLCAKWIAGEKLLYVTQGAHLGAL